MSSRVRSACEACFAAHDADAAGFVRAVAATLGIQLYGAENDIVDQLRFGMGWEKLSDGTEAVRSAQAGKLVLAGLRGDEQVHPSPRGHVAVIVDGPLAHGAYPSAYWTTLDGGAGQYETINFAWTTEDRQRVTYAAFPLDDI